MYKVGDRVVGTDKICIQYARGVHGTIREINSYIKLFLVEFDKDVHGHDGAYYASNKYKDGYCWWCEEKSIIPEINELKFKKGDLVRIKGTEYKSSYAQVLRKVGTIVDAEYERLIDDEQITYRVKVDNEINERQIKGLWVFHEETSLELVSENKPQDGIKAKCIVLDDIIKGDNNMEDIIKIYEDRKMEKVNKRYDRIENLIKMDDPRYKVWRECVNTLNKMYKEDEILTLNFAPVKLSDETAQRVCDLNRVRLAEEIKVKDKIDEVTAQLQLCETYDQKQEILRRYNIINKNGKINA